ncbi:putative pentatricopeptide repeat-containing protein At3g47840 [Argentina anserina]|uniref:putative pentatricopeptide repeat-containing protein At3g47840 n=1 Tax=Argentina anserina TaxID=57926 RepID=UPI0021765DAF|nr:putative pentatricopeptide repeat-containing protein At3g47840 [Potentilla anserina]
MVSSIRSHIRRICTTSPFAHSQCRSLLAPESKTEQLIHKTHQANHVDILELNSQLKRLVKMGNVKQARKVFDKMPKRDEVSWTNMISGYIGVSDSSEALALFSHMWAQPGFGMDPFLLSVALKACGLGVNLSYGEVVHGYSVKSDFVSSVYVGSALVDMYMKVGEIEKGCRVFDEMRLRNVVSWTSVITGLVRAGYNVEGLSYFAEMWKSRVQCDAYAFAISLKACANLGALNCGREVHAQTMKKGFDENSFVANSLTTMYNKCGKLDYGGQLFANMRMQDVISWTSIITSYFWTGQEDRAMKAFMQMQESGVRPNEYTFAAVISGCASLARVEWGELLHGNVLRLGLADYLSVGNSIITMYAKCGCLTSASAVFREMGSKDIVSWTTVIAGYSQAGYGEEAFKYLMWMRQEGPEPNEYAFASLLSVCGSMAMLEQGKQLHTHVLTVGLDSEAMVQSALINLYSKCGSIQEAAKNFDMTKDDDVISWTSMINGYAQHGYYQEAIDLFEKIHTVGLKPDSVTFVGVLAACSHAGLVDLGFHYFNSMSNDFKISPLKEHYGCMIDLLCRAGRLSDAKRMIKSMPVKDDVAWSTLLTASRLHGDVECGRHAAEEILKLNPNCAVTHITLASIYAAKGMWRKAAEIRRMMRWKGVIKEPGWSGIEVRNSTSVFVAEDRSHPQGDEIYGVLELLDSKADNSIPETVLH